MTGKTITRKDSRYKLKYSHKAIMESQRKVSCILAGKNIYVADYFEEILGDINKTESNICSLIKMIKMEICFYQ